MGWRADRGVFTLSLDFELVWGSRDLSPDPDSLVAASQITRDVVFTRLLKLMKDCGITATWATVGHLFLGEAQPGEDGLHPDVVPPTHAWHPAPWFDGVPAGTEADHPAWYGRSLVEQLRDAGQDVGSHSFSHPIFGDQGCSRQAADTDLARCVAEAEALGVRLKSFVFPRNRPGHVDLLLRHGFTCWRPPETTWYRRPRVPHQLGRALHLADVIRSATPPTVTPWQDAHGLWCIPASATFLPVDGARRLIPISRRVKRSIRGIDQAVKDRKVSHLYLHPINLAADPEGMLQGLGSVLHHAARLRDRGLLEILSMAALADRAAAS